VPATIEVLTGDALSHTHFGRSLLPVLAGETDEHPYDAVFCEGGRLHGETHCKELESISSQNPEGLHWPRTRLQGSEEPEHTKAVMCRTTDLKCVRRLYESDELCELRSDPGELTAALMTPAWPVYWRPSRTDCPRSTGRPATSFPTIPTVVGEVPNLPQGPSVLQSRTTEQRHGVLHFSYGA